MAICVSTALLADTAVSCATMLSLSRTLRSKPKNKAEGMPSRALRCARSAATWAGMTYSNSLGTRVSRKKEKYVCDSLDAGFCHPSLVGSEMCIRDRNS